MRQIDNLNELDFKSGLDGLQTSLSVGFEGRYILPAQVNAVELQKANAPLFNVTPTTDASIVGAVGNGGGDDGAVAALADGGFVVVWTNITALANVPDGFDISTTFIGARIFNADGTPRTDAFQINTADDEIEGDPTVTALTGGGFVVGWEAVTTDGRDLEAYGRVFNADGSAVSDAFTVADSTEDDQGDVSFAALADGGFFAVWSDERESGRNDMHLYGNYFDADGTARGEDFVVTRFGNEDFHSLAVTANDGSLVAIGDSVISRIVGDVDRDANPPAIDTSRFGFTRGDIGDEWAAAAAGPDGVAFVSRQNSQLTLYFQGENSNFTASVTDESSLPTSEDVNPALVALADGAGFVVAWQQEDADGDFNIYAQLFDQYGRKVGDNTLIHDGTDGIQGQPWITQLAGGEVIIGWTSDQQADGAAPSDLYFREFDLPADFNADDPYGDALEEASIVTINRTTDLQNSFLTNVGSVGDVNGDGVDDFLLYEQFRGNSDSNFSTFNYIVFGVEGQSLDLVVGDLSNSANASVFTIIGDEFYTTSIIGDFNGDGFADFVVDSGSNQPQYIIFGEEGGLSGEITLADLDGSDGFQITPSININNDITSADLNNDGLMDLMVSGQESYAVIYGQETVTSGAIDFADLTSETGLTFTDTDTDNIFGIESYDIDGDGIADLLFRGRITEGDNDDFVNIAYFGGDGGPVVGHRALDASSGNGAAYNGSQYSFGNNRVDWDFNNDGVNDYWTVEQTFVDGESVNELKVWFLEANTVYNEENVFGRTDESDLTLTVGVSQFLTFNNSVTLDFNGDGIEDLAFFDRGSSFEGRLGSIEVIFGNETASGNVTRQDLGGYRLEFPFDNGTTPGIFAIGDINNDGFEDFSFAASQVDFLAGQGTIIVYGNEGNLDAQVGDTVRVINGDETNDTINGNAGRDRIEGRGGDDVIDGGDGDDALFGNFGRDTIVGGAGNDIIVGDNDLGLEDLEGIIYRAFVAVFDRAPDPAGFDIYLQGILIGDLTVQDMLAEFIASQEFQNTYGNLSNAEFMEQLYLNVLDREGDAAGLQSYTAALDAGTLTRDEVVAEFLDSSEFIELIGLDSFAFATSVIVSPTQSAVYRLYQAVFDREPDAAGFELYGNGLELDTVELTAIAAEFVASQEFTDTYGALDNESFIELLYQNVFGREADDAGLQAYLSALDSGTLSRADVVLEFAQSNEFRQQTEDAAEAFIRAFNDVPGDTLDGGTGDDILYGGRGADTFLFDTSDGGNDTIMDFEIGIDQIGDLGGLTFEEIIALGSQDGADAVFQFSADVSLTLANIDLDDLTRDDFGLSASAQKAVDTAPLIAEVDHGVDADAGAASLTKTDIQDWVPEDVIDDWFM